MNIEQTLSEHAVDEITRLLLDDSVVTTALRELLHRDTGCDIPSLDNVPISDVEEVIPLCTSILRRFWNTPLTALGDGIKKQSIADLLRQTIGDRVQGNEAWSIPPANANIPTAVAALRQRDMSSGLTLTLTDGGADGSTPTTTSLPDGLSLAQLLCSGLADNITELQDSNKGWTFANNSIFTILKAQEYHLNCVNFAINASYGYNYGQGFLRSNNMVKVLDLPYFEGFIGGGATSPALYCYYAATCNALEELLMPSLWRWNGENQTNDNFNIVNCPNLRKVVFGSVRQASQTQYYFSKCPNLIHLEFGQGTKASLNLAGWNPTTALSERLPEFISNFQTYIADRVADMTGKTALTLTLSSAVYAVLEAQEGQTILATLANKNWNVAQA